MTVHAGDPQLTRATIPVQPNAHCSNLTVTINTASGGVSLYDAKAGKHLYSLPAETGGVHWLAWSPDGGHVAVARENGKVAIWHLEKVEQILAQLGLNP